jgi:hypothetical protein
MGECIRVVIERVKWIWARDVVRTKTLKISCEIETLNQDKGRVPVLFAVV